MQETQVPALELLPQYRGVRIEQRKRDYLVDGVSYRRVSSVLGVINKPALLPAAKRIMVERTQELLLSPEVGEGLAHLQGEDPTAMSEHDDYRKWVDIVVQDVKKVVDDRWGASAETGTRVHEEITEYLHDKREGTLSGYAAAAKQFLDDWHLSVAHTEMPLWDDELKVAGTCDLVALKQDGCPVLLDWKTGSGPWWEMALQLGAYSRMFTKLTGKSVVEASIVKLSDEGYSVHEVSDLHRAEDSFVDAVRLHAAGLADWWRDGHVPDVR